MNLNKLRQICIKAIRVSRHKFFRSKPQLDMAVGDGCSMTLVSQTCTSKHWGQILLLTEETA